MNPTQEKIYQISFTSATCIAEMIGGGVVALPYAVSVFTPPIGMAILFAVGILTLYTGWLLGELFLHSEMLHPFPEGLSEEEEIDMEEFVRENSNSLELDDGNEIPSTEEEVVNENLSAYSIIAKESCGWKCEYLAYGSQLFTLFSVDVIFLILSGFNFELMIETQGKETSLSLSMVILILFTSHMLTAISTLLPPVVDSVVHLTFKLRPSMEEHHKKYVVRFTPVVIQTFAGAVALILQQDFFMVMALLGNTTVILCTFILPAIFYLEHPNIQESTFHKICCSGCVIFGVIAGIMSIGMFFWGLSS